MFLFEATGSRGYEILKRLDRDRNTLKVPTRNPAKLKFAEIKLPQSDQVKLMKGNVFKPGKLTEHFKYCDLIISTLGTGTDNR